MKFPVFLSLFAVVIVSSLSLAKESNKNRESVRPDADGWYSLFNGKDLSGWKKAKENPDTFKVVDGEIVVNGPRCHIFYAGPVNKGKFTNFEWKCDILTKPKSNSGMYFHTRYQSTGWPKRESRRKSTTRMPTRERPPAFIGPTTS
jgi:hypothetical protein